MDEEIDDMDEDLRNSGDSVPEQAAGPGQVGKYHVAEVAKVMSGIPSKQDWAEMERSGLNSAMQKCVEHLGQVILLSCKNFLCFLFPYLIHLKPQLGKFLSGVCNIAFEDLTKVDSIITVKDSQISELEL